MSRPPTGGVSRPAAGVASRAAGGTPRPGGEDGFLTVQFVAVAALSLVLFTLLAEVLVTGYGRAAVRAALDEAARTASRLPAGAPAEQVCTQHGRQTLDALVGGRLGAAVTVRCEVTATRVVARADAVWAPWVPLHPPWELSLTATALRGPAR